MLDDIITETNELRRGLGPREVFTQIGFLQTLAKSLQRTRYLRTQPIVQRFIEDLESCDEQILLTRTKAHINHKQDHSIFSLFDASYFPALSLDYLAYRPLEIHTRLATKYQSNTTPITLERMSQGFHSRVVVALFPENHIDHLQEQDDLIFYFIDKFIERHKKITRKLLANVVSDTAFPLLRNASDAQLEKAAVYWVWLHEYHHRQGDMPIPRYLPYKSLKPLAGLEELRVDVSGLLVCLHDGDLPAREAELAYEFILAERLLRYAVEGIPKPNYDAVASQLLFNYLRELGGISTSDNVLHLAPALPGLLAQFLSEIHTREAYIRSEPPVAVQKRLLDFTNAYTDYDETIGDYRHIDFFMEIKNRLAL